MIQNIPNFIPGFQLFEQNQKDQEQKEDIEEDQKDEDDQEEEEQKQELAADELIDYILFPIQEEDFTQQYQEKQPFAIRRMKQDYFKEFELSLENIREKIVTIKQDQISDILKFQVYEDNKVEDVQINSLDEIKEKVNKYANNNCDCIISVEQPQFFNEKYAKIESLLESYFGTLVSLKIVNNPNGQENSILGYKGHECFILQISGEQTIQAFKRNKPEFQFPRVSSQGAVDKSELSQDLGKTKLSAGDVLYLSKGIVYSGENESESNCQFMVIEFNKDNTWGDILERAVPSMIQQAIQETYTLRKNLPKNYLSYMGVMGSETEANQQYDENFNSSDEDMAEEEDDGQNILKKQLNEKSIKRQQFIQTVKDMMMNIIENDQIFQETLDNAIDDIGIQFTQNKMPPVENIMKKKKNSEKTQLELEEMGDFLEELEIRLVSKDIGRLISQPAEEEEQQQARQICEENGEEFEPLEDIVFHHCGLNNTVRVKDQLLNENSAPQIFPVEAAGALEQLFNAYPNYVAIMDLELENEQDKATVAETLYKNGLVTFRKIQPI
ncbi:hypothetical protein PPERSA_06804 [Pseudocohnilembus persalinus]|uniref:Bifunctional lysine-specific demethylase and histidyl-hydroxylase n=1 Tax=Pseudocohnilembus persalinus TaxID=266149 RepID=A0A0V0QSA2_PSEPJ|nr:hypothetical protein PPERSA_06804 [Pseudocohnilembus persalinus]|eukprot:KRX05170.1 hypothetical protein PPERSA_06804 [Pseudocohnilembus persalinus]